MCCGGGEEPKGGNAKARGGLEHECHWQRMPGNAQYAQSLAHVATMKQSPALVNAWFK